MAKKCSIILELFQCLKTSSILFATLATRKFQGVEVVQSYICTTTNLVSHVVKHPNVNKQYTEQKSVQEAPPIKETCKRKIEQQFSLKQTQELSEPWT